MYLLSFASLTFDNEQQCRIRWSGSSRRACFRRTANGAPACASAIKTLETVSEVNLSSFILYNYYSTTTTTLCFPLGLKMYAYEIYFVCAGCFALCCLPVFTCKVTKAVGACPCLPLLDCIGCVPPASLAMRASVRQRYGIQVDRGLVVWGNYQKKNSYLITNLAQ